MAERRTVTLSEPAAQALFWVASQDDCSLTDAHNRAIRGYATIRRLLKDGAELTVTGPGGDKQKIVLI